MYSSLLRLALIVLFCLFVAPLVAQDKNEDPFGEVVEKPKKEEVVEDPFGGPEPVPTVPDKQESEKENSEQEEENPFGTQVPTQTKPKQEMEDPFNVQDPAKQIQPAKQTQPATQTQPADSTQPMTTDATGSQDIQGGGDGEKTEPAQELPTERTFEEKFWDYLKSNAYENWAPAPGQSADLYVGESPHGAFLKMYINRIAMGDSKGLPNGSIIVKENYGVDRETLKAVTVMYRSKAYNPDGGDWYWIKYNPDGTVATTSVETGANKIMGRAKGCINCHRDAGGDDFAFFNDK